MVFQNIAFWLVFSCLSVLGLGLKVSTIPSASTVAQLTNPFDDVHSSLHLNGYRLAASRAPTTDKSFIVHLYQKPSCAGYLVLLPLSRNSEAKELLKTRFSAKPGKAFFVLSGKRFDTFPSAELWWRNVRSAIANWGQGTHKSLVWAVVETADCVNSEPIHSDL